ncbi:hypothetical protein ACH427_26465 [Streptomyces sp. NPDC020379]|uniref:hypothetical protein n=1 Tax=Streptomyces sp. NPDC020379 TaxID=3365071 RepID=UPI00379E216F
MRSGPRHAAARKPLLARLHMPAGKAVAIAAMPTAVLMGMGFTPQLALAKPPLPEPFDGQCATAPDASPEPGASGSTSPGPAPSRSAKESATRPTEQPSKAPEPPSAKPEARPETKPEARPEPGKSPDAGNAARTGPSPAPSPSASPSPSKSFNPLDPLGLGDKLRDILDGGRSGAGKQPSAPPSSAPAPSGGPSSAPSGAQHVPPPADARTPDGRPSGKASTAPSTEPSRAPSSAPPSTAPSPGASPGTSASPGALPPCPKGKAVDGNDGHAFPDQPWYLEASVLTLKGLTYDGIKKITMANGQQKSVLKFTADALTIKDLHQIVNSYGKEYHVAGPGTDSTVTGGQVTMYTEELKGNLLGLIPSTASPTSPPPLIPGLKLPIPIFYTNVKIRQGGQFGGTLHIPNLHQYLTNGTYP